MVILPLLPLPPLPPAALPPLPPAAYLRSSNSRKASGNRPHPKMVGNLIFYVSVGGGEIAD